MVNTEASTEVLNPRHVRVQTPDRPGLFRRRKEVEFIQEPEPAKAAEPVTPAATVPPADPPPADAPPADVPAEPASEVPADATPADGPTGTAVPSA